MKINVNEIVEKMLDSVNPLEINSCVLDLINEKADVELLEKLAKIKNYAILFKMTEQDYVQGYISYVVFLSLKSLGSGDDTDVIAQFPEKMAQAYNKRLNAINTKK